MLRFFEAGVNTFSSYSHSLSKRDIWKVNCYKLKTMAEKKLKIFTLEEYLVLENQLDVKNEFDHGSIVALSGGL